MAQVRPTRLAIRPANLHAFVVDDDAQMSAIVAKILISQGFSAHEFTSGQEVEAALTRWAPKVIILDLSLGNSDAVEILRSLEQAHFAGYVLLISGHDAKTLNEVCQIGVTHGLQMLEPLAKPFRSEDLKKQLARIPRTPADLDSDVNLEAGLRNNWLELWYQPKIDLNSMLVCGAEALIRLRHPKHGIVLPSDFLPTPGDPLFVPLTDFIMRRALSDWALFAEQRMTSRLAINVPASVLQRPDFVDNLRRHMPTRPDFPGLIVEITEDEAISDPELAHEIAVQLKLYGVSVSVDDFGAGHSTMARLRELPFAEIKLDRSFVSGCDTDEQKRAMCQAVMELSRRFDIPAVAEGVETRAELSVLKEMGYPIAQGFLFAKPMSGNDFVELLVSRTRARA